MSGMNRLGFQEFNRAGAGGFLYLTGRRGLQIARLAPAAMPPLWG